MLVRIHKPNENLINKVISSNSTTNTYFLLENNTQKNITNNSNFIVISGKITIFMEYFILFALFLRLSSGIILPEACPYLQQFDVGLQSNKRFLVKKIPFEEAKKPSILLNEDNKTCISIYYASKSAEIITAFVRQLNANNMSCLIGFSGIYENSKKEYFVVQDTNTNNPPRCKVPSGINTRIINVFSDNQGELIWSCYVEDGFARQNSRWTVKSDSEFAIENTQDFGQSLTKMMLMVNNLMSDKLYYGVVETIEGPTDDIEQFCKPVKTCLINYCTKPINITTDNAQSCNENIIAVTSAVILIVIIAIFLFHTLFPCNLRLETN